MKVRLAEGGRYYYPDLIVACGDPGDEPDEYTETLPTMLVEILSSSTEATDRREKRLAYQAIPGLVDYLIVSQEMRTIDLFSRASGIWTEARFVDGDSIELASIDLTLPVGEVYGDLVRTSG